MNAITIKDLTKSYSGTVALIGVYISIREGEFFGLLGPNGAGKTTTINILTGLVRKDAGETKVFGSDTVTDFRFTRKQVGISAQEFTQDWFFPLDKLLLFQAGYYGIKSADAIDRVESLLDRLGLREKRNARIRQLSGGMKRRFQIAKALVHDPKILILDEPTAGVDVELRHELWRFFSELHNEGTVMHTAGWPAKGTASGSYCYHGKNNQLYMGYVVPLDYKNPYLSPYDEFQQWKHNSGISKLLKDGTRVAYGARALIKGGFQSRPKMSFNGGLIVGDNAGTLNFPKIKGTHTAMKSGMIAAEVIHEAMENNNIGSDLVLYEDRIQKSWLQKELYKARNFGPLLHKFGNLFGPILAAIDQFIFRGNLPFTLNHPTPDYACLEDASKMPKINYPKPDGVISFDKLSSVYLSNTTHEEDQPCHLKLKDENIPISVNLPKYAEPAQRYCPAGVYEVVNENNQNKFVINAQNCVHCKTCDIKDPSQNITWVTPEGMGGPNYLNM